MEKFLERLIVDAQGLSRPQQRQCAIEKYTQMSPSEINACVGEFVTKAAQHFKFYPEEHSDWVYSGSVMQERDGARLLDVFLLKYPAIVVPEMSEFVQEYEWYKSCDPDLFQTIDIDGYMEEFAKIIFQSLEVYREALQEWAVAGRPSELDDCLRNANLEDLRRYEEVQRKRTRAVEQSYARHHNAGAPPHVLERVQALSFREQMALSLIQESIDRL